MESPARPPKLKSMVTIQLDWINPRSCPNVRCWEVPIEEAMAFVTNELHKPNPQLCFVPAHLADSKYVGADKVIITNSTYRRGELGFCISELAFIKDDVRFGRGGVHGVLIPKQDEHAVCGTVELTIRKYGKGAQSFYDDDILMDGFVDPEIPDDFLDLPDTIYPTKPKAKRGGGVVYTDQYGFDADGVLVKPIVDLLGPFKSGYNLANLLDDLAPYKCDDGYELPTGTVCIAFEVVRKNVPVAKQNIFTVQGVLNQLVPGIYYPYSSGSKVITTKPARDSPAAKTVSSIMLSLYGTSQYAPVTPVARIACTTCGFLGWLPLKDAGTVVCGCNATYNMTSTAVQAESSGFIRQGAVLCLEKGEAMRLVPGGRTYLAFGGAIWSPIGKDKDVTVWVPRTYSVLCNEHSGVVGTGDVRAYNEELVSLLSEGFFIDEEALAKESVSCMIADALPEDHDAVTLNVDLVKQYLFDANVPLGQRPVPSDPYHPAIQGVSYHVRRACTLAMRAGAAFEAVKTSFYKEVGRILVKVNFDYWQQLATVNIPLRAFFVLDAMVSEGTVAWGHWTSIAKDLLAAFKPWLLNVFKVTTQAIVDTALALTQFLQVKFTYINGEFSFLVARLNQSCEFLRNLFQKLLSAFKTTTKWAGCAVEGIYTNAHCFFSRTGMLVEKQFKASSLGFIFTPRQAKAEIEVLEGDFDVPVELCSEEVDENAGTLEEVFGASDLQIVRGQLSVLASKLFVRTEEGLFYRYVSSGGVLLKAFRLRGGGGVNKVTFGDEDVHEIPHNVTVSFTYDVCDGLNAVLDKLMPPFEVESDTDLEDLAILVQEAVTAKLQELFSDCPRDVRPIDIEEFSTTPCYIYNKDYEKILSAEMYFSLEDVTPDDDDEQVASASESSDDEGQGNDSDSDGWLSEDNLATEEEAVEPAVIDEEPLTPVAVIVPGDDYTRVNDYIYIKCGDIVEEAKVLQPNVLVNAANSMLKHGGGVAGAINKATGNAMQKESDVFVKHNGPLKTGDGVMLSPHGLAKQGILHVVGPDKRKKQPVDHLHAVYRLYNQHVGVMTPLVSAGIFGFTPEESWSILLQEVQVPTFVVVNDVAIYDKLRNGVSKPSAADDEWAAAVDQQENNIPVDVHEDVEAIVAECVTAMVKKVARKVKLVLPTAAPPVPEEVVQESIEEKPGVALQEVVTLSLMQMITQGKERGSVTALVIDYPPFNKVVRRCNPQKGFYTANGQDFFGYSRDTPLDDVITAINKEGRSIIMLPLGYIVNGKPLAVCAATMRKLTVPHVVVVPSDTCVPLYNTYYMGGVSGEANAATEFVVDAVANGVEGWDIVQKTCQQNGRCYKTFAHRDGIYMCHDDTNLFALTSTGVLKFATTTKARDYMASCTKVEEPLIKVYTTVNGLEYNTVYVDTQRTFGVQIGTVYVSGSDYTNRVPTANDDGVQLFKQDNFTPEESEAIRAYYGVFETDIVARVGSIQRAVKDWQFAVVDGRVTLQQMANNCYLNAALLLLQDINVEFTTPWVKHAYDSLRGGNPLPMVTVLVALGKTTIGNPDDANMVITAVLTHATVNAKRVTTTVCDTCGAKHEEVTGILACTYYGSVVLDDLYKPESVVCTCGRSAIRFVSVQQSPWVLMSHVPTTTPLEPSGHWTAAIVFRGSISNGHYMYARRGMLVDVYDATTRKRTSDLKVPATDVLYTNVNFTSASKVVTYTLDGQKHTAIDPDLSSYTRRGDYYFTTVPVESVAAPRLKTKFDNFYLTSSGELAEVESFNKVIGTDFSGPKKVVTRYPDCSGDVVAISDEIVTMHPHGTLIQGKPVLFLTKPNTWKKLVPLLSASVIEVGNKYEVLPVEPLPTVCTEEVVVTEVKATVPLYGLKGTIVLDGKTYVPGKKGDLLCLREFTYADFVTATIEGPQPFVLLRENHLSKLLGLKVSKETLLINKLNPCLLKSFSITKTVTTKFWGYFKTAVVAGCRASVRTVRRTQPGVRLTGMVCLFYRFMLALSTKLVKPPTFKVTSIVTYNTGCAVTRCVINYFKSRFSSFSLTRITRLLKFVITLWFAWTLLMVLSVWLSEPYAPTWLTGLRHKVGISMPCDYVLTNDNVTGWFHDFCMAGMDNLAYPALRVVQQRMGSPYDYTSFLFVLEIVLAYVLYTPLLPGVGIFAVMHTLLNWFPNMLGSSWLMVFIYHVVRLVPLISLLRLYIALSFLWVCYRGLCHVRFGCNNVSCLMCYKRNGATRVECSTIVAGVKRSFYVNANGGTYFCTKHNWNCVNCDSYSVDSTFISRPVALDLSAQFKRPINHTDEAYYEVTSVEVKHGYVYAYFDLEGKRSYEKFPMDKFANPSKYYFSELKGVAPSLNVIIFDASNTIEENAAKTSAVFFAQLACRPMLLIDKRMIGVVGDEAGISKAMFEAYAQNYLLRFSIPMDKIKALYTTALQQIASGSSVESVLKVFVGSTRNESKDIESDVETTDIVSCLRFCHQEGWDWSVGPYNNLIPTYLKQDTLTTLEVGQLISCSARYVNANIAKSSAINIVWRFSDFIKLSESLRRQIRIAARKTGLNLQLTTSSLKADVTCVVTPIRVVGGHRRKVAWCSIFIYSLMLLFVLNPQWLLPRYSLTKENFNVMDFKVIDNAAIRDITASDVCFANKFSGFDDWYFTRYGQTYTNDVSCPMVVGVISQTLGTLYAGLPARFLRVGRSLLPLINFAFGMDGQVCYTPYTAVDYTTFADSACVLASACTLFKNAAGEPVPYCASNNLLTNATLYKELTPHMAYPLYESNGYIRFPDTITAGVHIVTLKAMEYCRLDRCDISDSGVCVSLTPRWVVNNFYYRQQPGVYCGSSTLDMLYQVVLPVFRPAGTIDITSSVLMGAALAFLVSIVLYYLLKFRRAFGDYTTVVAVNMIAFFLNLLVLCLESAYPLFPTVYAFVFLYATCYFTSDVSAIMHLSFMAMFTSVVPLWVTVLYIVVVVSRHTLWLASLCTRPTVTVGDLSFTSFQDASLQTFMLDKDVFLRLKREISAEMFARYLALFPKYKYYSGPMDTNAYREAACAHLAMALEKFSSTGGDVVYQPPRCSVTAASLQGGLAKMAHPSGPVEKCVVKVTYGTMTLNGIWLDDYVLCPRHVLCSRDDLAAPDYPRLCMRAANYDFIVTQQGHPLRVTGHTMEGALLKLTLDARNPNTPAYSFIRVATGQAISLLACYDGNPMGVYTCTMRGNGTLKASFLCGSCGSPGYVMNGKEVQFCYLHQLELPNGTHTGTDMQGVFYGPFEDKQVPQMATPDQIITVNVLAWLYAAVLSGDNWFVVKSGITPAEFNTAAIKHMCQSVSTDTLSTLQPLAAKTGISVERMLASLKLLLATGFCGKTIMGACTLEDEHTPYDIGRQMLGVSLQSRLRSTSTWLFQWFITVFVLTGVFTVHLFNWTFIGALPFTMQIPIIGAIACVSAFLSLLVKHKYTYLSTYLLPVVTLSAYYNYQYQPFGVQGWILWLVNYVKPVTFIGLDIITIVVTCVIAFTLSLRLVRSDMYTRVWYVFTAICWVYSCLTGTSETLPFTYLTFMVSVFTNYTGVACVSLYAARFIVFILCTYNVYLADVGSVRLTLIVYLFIGFINTCYFGFFNLVNKLFRCTLGTYDYLVSSQELRYMNSNGLLAPTNSWQAFLLNIKLAGIGGIPMYKVSTVQSQLTDLKCTSVVLLSVLQQLRIESSSKLWALCVKMHNDILASNSASDAFESFVSLLSVLLSLPGAINLDELCNSIMDNNTVLQAVASEFSNLASYVDYENAQKAYDTAVSTGAPASTIKALKKAMNVAKSVLDKDVAVARRLERMSEIAMTTMYKQARAEDKRSKVTSAMQTMLFNMIRRLDSDALSNILNNARNGVVPLGVIPRTAANKLMLVVPDYSVFSSTITLPVLTYAGSAWDVVQIADADAKAVNTTDITRENSPNLAWPLVVTAQRQQATSPVKLQNNELMPQTVKRMNVTAGISQTTCTTEALAYYNSAKEGKHVMAILANVDGLKCARVEKSSGDGFVVIELEPPCKFMVETPKGPTLKYLYFTKGLNNLCRGTVLGTLACTVRLHAGSATEVTSNSSILSLCAFSVDPEATYKEYVDNGGAPIGNCVKMLTPHTGTGLAVTAKPDANMEQESFGGASCCLYCRCHIEHPGPNGVCKFKGKFVQLPLAGVQDPIGFCIRNVVCSVCNMWQGYGCPCASLREVNLQAKDANFLNESGVLVE
uniref:ORF1a protein n=1 Tax=Eidolon bat coronavirus TaxID=2717680 RepID=A0AB38ZDV9_9NIDO